MDFLETIGIDISKPFIDVHIHKSNKHRRFENTQVGFIAMDQWVETNTPCVKGSRLFAFEHTGLYSIPLSVFLAEKEECFIVIPGLELKRSMGLVRGKNDKIDAKTIALFAYRRRDELSPYELPSKKLLDLRHFLRLREKLVKQRSGYKATLKEMKTMLGEQAPEIHIAVHIELIDVLSEKISQIEKKMRSIVRDDENLKSQFLLITSIKGVGEQTALFMIVFTNAFTLFENARKFASYSGIAPFPHQSGISIRGKTKTSNLANKKFKTLLTNCASSAKIHNQEIKTYYERKVNEGKHKMSVVNAIRNKLLGRIFAVIKRGTPYADTMGFAS